MATRGYADAHFDAVVCVFGIFFVPDMEPLLAELWRMVRPGGKLAVTTWGPRFFAPACEAWNTAVRQVRPDLHAAYHPWDRIMTPRRSGRSFVGLGFLRSTSSPRTGFSRLALQRIFGPSSWAPDFAGPSIGWDLRGRNRSRRLSWRGSPSTRWIGLKRT